MNEVRRHVLTAVLVAATVLTVHATAQELNLGCSISQSMTDEELAERNIDLLERCGFELFNECRPVDLLVRVQDVMDLFNEAPEIGRMEERIRTMAESRLRAARIYAESSARSGGLTVEVAQATGRYLVTVGLHRYVFEPVSGKWSFVLAWKATDARFCFPLSTSDSAIQNVSDGIDKFISEYLRVNESACK